MALSPALRRGRALSPWLILRLWLYCSMLCVCVLVVTPQPLEPTTLFLVLSLGYGAFALCLVFAPAVPAGPRRALRALDLALLHLCVVMWVGEPMLRALARVHPSPLLAHTHLDPGSRVEHNRYSPGELRYGFPCNESGHYDTPFLPKVEGQRLVVAIGDSFSAGVVPHYFHFTTVAERELEATAIYNMGVPAIGPREYLHLLKSEALPLAPDVIVVNLFVGNDLEVASSSSLSSWFDRRNLLLYQVPRRLGLLARERGDTGRVAGSLPGERELRVRLSDPEALKARFPWIGDPVLEEPVFSERAYLELERARASSLHALDERGLDELFGVLEEIQQSVGGARLAFLIIPDEFQVEDSVWNAMKSGHAVDLDRDRPQRELTAWLEERRIPHVDLLPQLRAVAPAADGRRHVYHLRDSHWNARGNEVAGRALADLLESLEG